MNEGGGGGPENNEITLEEYLKNLAGEEKVAPAVPLPEATKPEKAKIKTKPSSRLDEEEADKKAWWKGPIGCVSGIIAIACCSIAGSSAVLVPQLRKFLGINLDVDLEWFKPRSDIEKEGLKLTKKFINEAQKKGGGFGEGFYEGGAKEEGSKFVLAAHQETERLFDEKNIHYKTDPVLTQLITQHPLLFEPNDGGAQNFDLIFNQQQWSIAQKLYMETIALSAAEKGVDPNNDGLESWLMTNNKDSVYAFKNNETSSVNISGAHLLQLLWDEYKSGDNIAMSQQDQRLFIQYWRASGRNWIRPESRHRQPAAKEQLGSSQDFNQFAYDLAGALGVDREEVLSNIYTLQVELVANQTGIGAKTLDMAEITTMGIETNVDSVNGAILGLMVMAGLGRKRLGGLISLPSMKEAIDGLVGEGKRFLSQINVKPEIGEIELRQENARRLVNRLKYGLSLSREVVMDLGEVLLDPNNQDMKDLILTEGPNWFRYVPEDHPEARQIMSFFGCANYQQLQELANQPQLIVDRLHQVLQTGRKTSHKTQNRQILDLIHLYYLASRSKYRQ